MEALELCACGSGCSFVSCCGPIINGTSPAKTAEKLMRSRYTANVFRNTGYLLDSWHPSTRPGTLDPATISKWIRLQIIDVVEGAVSDEQEIVEFKATSLQAGQFVILQERSRFVREAGKWYYLDGDIIMHDRVSSGAVGRNTPCPCGSGRKYKKCCLLAQ